MSQYLFLLVVLACPLMMVWMMRGGHGHGHAGHSHTDDAPSTDVLRRRRDELDREIAAREEREPGGDHAPVAQA